MSNDRIYYSRAAEERAKRDQMVLTVLFLTLGLSIGAALALLFAPKAGEETREDLHDAIEHRSALQRIEDEFVSWRKQIDERLGDIQKRLSS